MIEQLKAMYQTEAKVERYEASSRFFSCMMEENSSISEHVLKCLGMVIVWRSWVSTFPMSWGLTVFSSHCHLATRAF